MNSIDSNSSYIKDNEIFYSNGDHYKGTFSKSGKKEGYGIYTDKEGNSYEGFYKNDTYYNYGLLKFKNHGNNDNILMCESTFDNAGNPNWACIHYKDKSIYCGEVDEDFLPNGQGKLRNTNGTTVEGDFKNSNRIKGAQYGKLENGLNYEVTYDIYDSEVKNKNFKYLRVADADGELVPLENNNNKNVEIKLNNNDVYIGECSDDFLKHGYGIYQTESYIYEGQFNNDMMDGYGQIYYKNTNETYIGQFKSDKKQGYGRFTWNNKEKQVYTGDFDNDNIEGFGQLSLSDNIIYTGEFAKSKTNGFGKLNFKAQNKEIYFEVKENNPEKIVSV